MNSPRSDAPDPWSVWLRTTRDGGHPGYAQFVRSVIVRMRDRLLDAADLKPGSTILDVGSGDGLVAFGAFDRVGPTLSAILTDVSDPLLEGLRSEAKARGVLERCRLVKASAEAMPEISSGSVDVVTTRSVLAYVADKRAALREFHRILRPGGRVCLGEPIFRDNAMEVATLGHLLATRGGASGLDGLRLLHRWKAAQFPGTPEAIRDNPLTNFSERDLVAIAQDAGFGEIHMEFHVDIRGKYPLPWEAFLDISPHPWAPSLREIMATQFSPEESRQFEAYLRPQVEHHGVEREAMAYLTAVKG